MPVEWITLMVAGYSLFVCGATSKNYVVGAALPPSGLFVLSPAGWSQRGFNHPNIAAADFHPADPNVLYLAAGNGCIRSTGSGGTWRILTDWRMTELQDVSLDRVRRGTIYVALPDGVGFSPDDGRTWTHRDAGITRKFVQSIQADRTRAGRVIAGAGQGIFLSEDSGLHWRLAGAAGSMVTHVEQSAREPGRWMAATQGAGLFVSADNGETWTPAPALTRRTLYNVAFDPHKADRVAVCGWSEGVLVSEDRAVTWRDRSSGLPSRRVWRVSFDPGRPNRLWASVHEEAVFVSDDLGVTWRRAGLEGTILRDFVFVPEAPR